MVGLVQAKGRRTTEATRHIAIARTIQRYANAKVSTCAAGPLGPDQVAGGVILGHKDLKRGSGQGDFVGLSRAKDGRTFEGARHIAIARTIHRYAIALVLTCGAGPLGPHEFLCPQCRAQDKAEAERGKQKISGLLLVHHP